MANFSPVELHKKQFKNFRPLMSWDESKDINEWKSICKDKLIQLLGLDTFEKCDPDTQIIKEELINENRHIHFIVQTEEGYYVNCHLLMKDNVNKRLPLCVCLQGHVSGAHLSLGIMKYDYDEVYQKEDFTDYCIQAVNEGFIGLAIEQRGFGENGGEAEHGWTQCQHTSMGAIAMGRTIIGERVWDVSRVIDAMEKKFSHLFTMDGSIIMGTSGGGTATYYTACLENRFELYIPGVAICSFYDSIIELSHCVCNYIPSIVKYFNMGDLAVLIAPKKMIALNASKDQWFPLDGAIPELDKISRIYKAFNLEDNFKIVIGQGGHHFYPDDVWPLAKEMLKKH